MNQQPGVIRIKINTCLNEKREENNIKACEANVLSLMMKRKLKKTQTSNGRKFLLTICILVMYIYCVAASKLLDEIEDALSLSCSDNFELKEIK
ncbi:hypothetical protein NBO_10g0075 [Nosema bombycis CQ1]|uniref:Uncharacterized protein n=1 Tax=Nosema bombycis (strain CQ1 / CVCC 102059) TaxID=578461 RepID=R0MLG4_NOSB1|nr:hypothetical protein NBO_10g0075 [Nosema bombycis CQ1]|eukprot:EOB15085.1 hypothetical protein NBO_10g0075 [Nosema bombycis CQ1]